MWIDGRNRGGAFKLINQVINIANKASNAILPLYYEKSSTVTMKNDMSPVTVADLTSNSIIIQELKKISNYPILTEESPIDYHIRKDWDTFWLVDPLDGTKNFISKTGEFTINIALITNGKPSLGVVYVPTNGDVYYAQFGQGAFKNGKIIFNNSKRKNLIGADSIFHSSEETKDFFKKHSIHNIKKYGSSLKICKLAEGEIDIYPRFNGTKEWDTAAAHIIANEAGCKIIDIFTKDELIYNKENIANNYFIGYSKNPNIKLLGIS